MLGNYPQLSLATARKEALSVLLLLERGEDPIEQRNLKRQQIADRMAREAALKADAINTFEKVARDWIEDRDKGNYWCHNPKGKFKTTRMLELQEQLFGHGQKTIGLKTIENLIKRRWSCACCTRGLNQSVLRR